MTTSRLPTSGNVIPMRAPSGAGEGSRAQAALYISQMTEELEQLANTAGLELVSYFLALARNEADTLARGPAAPDKASPPQAPYRID